jgi:hypothetical protein
MTENVNSFAYQNRAYPDGGATRQPFHHPKTSLGIAGHWVHLAGVLSPLVIGEVVKDPDKRWRAIRLASVGTALLTEALWTHRLMKKKEEREEHERELHR